ncbi:MAG TPA: SMP-30/gluconolactonase/LRE family protein [Alphaproteobacteria bacterium]|nr:SMP-30/gluconolactonase/LRE family protein [Alphaproteobacteria bacterium]
MRVETASVERLIDFPLKAGESPVWDARAQALYFADLDAPALFRFDPATRAVARWDMPSGIGSFGLCADGRAIVALRTGVHLFDFATRRLEFLVHPEPDLPDTRLNDGKVGPDGRFWVGTMHERTPREPVASLYRIDWDGTSTRMLGGLRISNGLAWSPDGRTLWHSDSRSHVLRCFDYDPATGAISNGRDVHRFALEDGLPDGAAMDAEGRYWSCGVTAGCLNRFGPDGTLDLKLELPILCPSMPCFGGPDLRTLYITSLTRARDGVEGIGTLSSLQLDVPGAPVGRFRERMG